MGILLSSFLRVSYDIFELWRHKPWWDGPLMTTEEWEKAMSQWVYCLEYCLYVPA